MAPCPIPLRQTGPARSLYQAVLGMIHPCWSLRCLNGAKMGPCRLDGFANVLKAPMVGPVSGGHTYVLKVGSPHRWKSSDNLGLGVTMHYLSPNLSAGQRCPPHLRGRPVVRVGIYYCDAIQHTSQLICKAVPDATAMGIGCLKT